MMFVVKGLTLIFCSLFAYCRAQDILGCGGFIKSEVEINFSIIEVNIVKFCNCRPVVEVADCYMWCGVQCD